MRKLIVAAFLAVSAVALAQECIVTAPTENAVEARPNKVGTFSNFRADGGCDVLASPALDSVQAQPRAVEADPILCRRAERSIERAMKLDARTGDGGAP